MKKPKNRRITLRVGDIYRIPLRDGRHAYAQLVFWDPRDSRCDHGPLVRVLDTITDHPVPVENLLASGNSFPPVYVGLKAGIQRFGWDTVGAMSVENFTFPFFRHSFATKPGAYDDWTVWDGRRSRLIGRLGPEQLGLEMLVTWSPQSLEERIRTGMNPYREVR